MNAREKLDRNQRAEARRLVAALEQQVDGLAHMIALEPNDVAIAELIRLHDDLSDAAALLDSYQAGIALATPHPTTDSYLIRRHRTDEMSPPAREVVLIWVNDGIDRGRPWLGHIDEDGHWWLVDSGMAGMVTHWAERPRSAAC